MIRAKPRSEIPSALGEGHHRGSPAYRRPTLAMLFAGFCTFSLLYSVQSLLPLRVLAGLSPIDIVRKQLEHNWRLANPHYKAADNNDLLPKVDEILYYANEVSQPDS